MTREPIRGKQPRGKPPLGLTELRDGNMTGYGSPEGVVAAKIGTVYRDVNPGGAGAVYKKTTASGKTGWVALGAGSVATNDMKGAVRFITSNVTKTGGPVKLLQINPIAFTANWDDGGVLDLTSTTTTKFLSPGWYIFMLYVHVNATLVNPTECVVAGTITATAGARRQIWESQAKLSAIISSTLVQGDVTVTTEPFQVSGSLSLASVVPIVSVIADTADLSQFDLTQNSTRSDGSPADATSRLAIRRVG